MKIYEIISERLRPTNKIKTNIKKSIASNKASFKMPPLKKTGNQYATLVGPKSKTWNQNSNATAIQNHANGMSADENWRLTGNVLGPGGNWRQEVDDSGAKIKPGKSNTLGNRLDHPKLTNAYQTLKGYGFDPEFNFPDRTVGGNFKGQFYNGGNITAPSAALKKRGLKPNKINIGNFNQDGSPRSNVNKGPYIGHELQHAADGIEGFPKGGSKSSTEVKNLAKRLGKTPLQVYQSFAGELAAQENARRWNMSPADRAAKVPTFSGPDIITTRNQNGTLNTRPNEWNKPAQNKAKQDAQNKAADAKLIKKVPTVTPTSTAIPKVTPKPIPGTTNYDPNKMMTASALPKLRKK